MFSFHSAPITSRLQNSFAKRFLCASMTIIILCIYIPAFWLFIISFYPFASTSSTPNFNSSSPLHNVTLPAMEAKYDRVILFLIDGLSFDVIKQNYKSDLPFIEKNIQHIKLLKAFAHAPTVTLPRLRALMSGQMPQFISDILSNLIESSASNSTSTEDSILLQSHLLHPHLPIHLFGDQTWFKLFGHSIFSKQSQGTTSLFVKDTVFVDTNVTQNVFVDFEQQLKNEPWRFLILHYLGFDHIGHCGMLHTPLMHSKLQEMNQAIEKVIKNYVTDDRTLLIVLSDHGMTDSGNHGGGSQQETDSFLLFVANSFFSSHNDSILFDTAAQVNQIDLAPTLSLLLQQPIPSKSIGKIIPQLFETQEQIIQAAKQNSIHLHRQFASTLHLNDQNTMEEWLHYQSQQSEQFSYQVSQRDWIGIFFSLGLFLLGFTVCALYNYHHRYFSVQTQVHYPVFAGFFVSYLLQSYLCSRTTNGMCHPYASIPVVLGNIGYFYGFYIIVQFYRGYYPYKSVYITKNWIQKLYEQFEYFIYVFSIVALLSSSFIEEEHYLWVHCTLLTCLFLWANSFFCGSAAHWYHFLLLLCCKWLQSYNSSGINFVTTPTLVTVFAHYSNWLPLLQFVLFSSIIVVDWWRMNLYASYSKRPSMPWLYNFEKYFFAFMTLCACIAKVFSISFVIPYLYICSVVCVVLSIANQLFVNLQSVFTMRDRSVHCIERVQLTLFFILCMVNRIEQSALLLVLGVFLALLNGLMKMHVEDKESIFLLIEPWNLQIAFFIFCRWSFFIFGRSISIATLDFSEAYQGLSEYQPVLLSILCMILLYGAPLILFLEQMKVMCFLQQPMVYSTKYTKLYPEKIDTSSVSDFYFKYVLHVQVWRFALLFVTCVMTSVMQNHLFIWSVFSPKIFYEIGWTIFYLITFVAGGLIVAFVAVFEELYIENYDS